MMAGWSTRQTGYLHEVDLTYALAIFTELLDIDPKQVRPFLDVNPGSYYKRAVKHVIKRRQPRIDRLKAISSVMQAAG